MSPSSTAPAAAGSLDARVADTLALEELRECEFSRLDAAGHIYVDYTGAGLYADSQVRRHADLLRSNVFGNPHSINPTSRLATKWVERTRNQVLEFFSADPEEYEAIFTANASHALKLVGESYPFEPGDRFLLTFDNHNSVNGLREYDRVRGAETTYVPLDRELRIDAATLQRELERVAGTRHRLFAFPAQSNFSGVRHDLGWVERARDLGWDVLLDAAAYVPTGGLDLSSVKPDFVALSFYKMFGYPTGVGALIARREALAGLHRPWFAGGTISVASVQADRFVMAPNEAAFEDGTVDFLAIPAVSYGLDLLSSIGMPAIGRRLRELTGELLEAILELKHDNGSALARIYGPRTTVARGSTVALNLFDREGRAIDHRLVEEEAARNEISLRTGCFCNPGAGESALELGRDDLLPCFVGAGDDITYEDFRQCIDRSQGSGAIRISLGLVSNRADVDAVVAFVRRFLV